MSSYTYNVDYCLTNNKPQCFYPNLNTYIYLVARQATQNLPDDSKLFFADPSKLSKEMTIYVFILKHFVGFTDEFKVKITQ